VDVTALEAVGRLGVVDPEDEAMTLEEFDRLLTVLPDDLKPVFALRLEGYTNAEIARQLDRVERTIELKPKTIRGLLRPSVQAPPQQTRTDAATGP
jgi:hypothetical protein